MENQNQLPDHNDDAEKLKAYYELLRVGADLIAKNPKATTSLLGGAIATALIYQWLKDKK